MCLIASGSGLRCALAPAYNTQVDPKPRPNHQAYLEALSRMTPSERAAKAFELSDMSKRLFREGLRRRFPDVSEAELQRLFLQGLAKCHNQNY